MEVKGVIASSPSNVAVVSSALLLVCLAFDADLHQVISADSTAILFTFPFPHGYRIPLFDDKLVIRVSTVNLHLLNYKL